mmetsp:Transcript_7565/g.46538  ORF Transcript_7565/g.46538 Transcript_7565/m.46538 type:complete len:90 (+) Transcript_7565:1770-2039(+)
MARVAENAHPFLGHDEVADQIGAISVRDSSGWLRSHGFVSEFVTPVDRIGSKPIALLTHPTKPPRLPDPCFICVNAQGAWAMEWWRSGS